jgi:hypothetical protein
MHCTRTDDSPLPPFCSEVGSTFLWHAHRRRVSGPASIAMWCKLQINYDMSLDIIGYDIYLVRLALCRRQRRITPTKCFFLVN